MLTPELRGRVEAAIEALIGLLDTLDGDCEDEGAQCEDEGVCGYLDPDLEPSLAATHALDQRHWAEHGPSHEILNDREEQCEDEGAQCEDEGFDSDREPEDFHAVPEYADAGMNQLRIASHYGPGITVSELGVR